MAYNFSEEHEEVEVIEVNKMKPERQIELIEKYKEEKITEEEKNELIGAIYRLVVKFAKLFSKKLPDRTINDMIHDGIANVWLRLKKYEEYRADKNGEIKRSVPSTFISIVLRTGYLKDIQNYNSKTSKLKKKTIDSKGEESEVEFNIPNMSLSNFIDENEEIFEPIELSTNPDNNIYQNKEEEKIDDKLSFDSLKLELFSSICETIQDYEILTNLLDITKISYKRPGRNRKCIQAIAHRNNTNIKNVTKIAKRVGSWIRKFDFVPHLARGNFIPPKITDVLPKQAIETLTQEQLKKYNRLSE